MLDVQSRQALVEAASEARQHAYAPYSNYQVGAALLTSTGRTFTGVNVENAAYPVSLCAERTAVFKAVSEGERVFSALAVVTVNGGMPCGSCRQVLSEFGLDTRVLIGDDSGRIIKELSVRDLLPFSFGQVDLDQDLP